MNLNGKWRFTYEAHLCDWMKYELSSKIATGYEKANQHWVFRMYWMCYKDVLPEDKQTHAWMKLTFGIIITLRLQSDISEKGTLEGIWRSEHPSLAIEFKNISRRDSSAIFFQSRLTPDFDGILAAGSWHFIIQWLIWGSARLSQYLDFLSLELRSYAEIFVFAE